MIGDIYKHAVASELGNISPLTFAQIDALITSSNLMVGSYYEITDHQTMHLIQYTTEINTAPIEPLIVQAIAHNQLSPNAISKLRPTDIIRYNFNDKLCEDGVTPRKGKITYRENTKYNIKLAYDWMNVKFRRWKINPPVFDPAVTYPINVTVQYSGAIFVSRIANNLGVVPDGNKNNWMMIWDLNRVFSQYKVIDYWVAYKPTGFNICIWNVDVDVTDYVDYYTLNLVDAAVNSDASNTTKNATFNLESGLYFNISIDLNTKENTPYNNIVFMISKLAGKTIENITMAGNCRNMTIGGSAANSRFGGESYDILIKTGINSCVFQLKFYQFVCYFAMSFIAALDEFYQSVTGEFAYNTFDRLVYRLFLHAKYRNSVATNEIYGAEFQGVVESINFNIMITCKFLGKLDMVTIIPFLQNRTITMPLAYCQLGHTSPDGSLWITTMDNTGHLQSEKVI